MPAPAHRLVTELVDAPVRNEVRPANRPGTRSRGSGRPPHGMTTATGAETMLAGAACLVTRRSSTVPATGSKPPPVAWNPRKAGGSSTPSPQRVSLAPRCSSLAELKARGEGRGEGILHKACLLPLGSALERTLCGGSAVGQSGDMARSLRMEFPGAIHHVSSRMRGSWRQARDRLFRDERDTQRFVERLSKGVADFGIRLHLFTLMSNHYHLVLETPAGNLSRFMQSLSTAYTVYFNQRHRRHGHLLDGRYKAKLVSGDD